MSSLTSSYAGALILASMAALGAAYLGDKVADKVKTATVEEPEPKVEPPTVETLATPLLKDAVVEPPAEDTVVSEEDIRRKLTPFVRADGVDAILKFVKTPVSEWKTVAPTTFKLTALVAKTYTHPDKCPATMVRVCALVFNKYSQMAKASKGDQYDQIGNEMTKLGELVDELPEPETPVPETPAVPVETPAVPVVPETPAVPVVPETPAVPVVPETPAVPVETPAVPVETPAVPVVPETPPPLVPPITPSEIPSPLPPVSETPGPNEWLNANKGKRVVRVQPFYPPPLPESPVIGELTEQNAEAKINEIVDYLLKLKATSPQLANSEMISLLNQYTSAIEKANLEPQVQSRIIAIARNKINGASLRRRTQLNLQ